ncbi:50S ribosomal protein L13 [Candidatus Dojkabacteria bacterium]|uniref:Large ribosomal subunit protein uL13 n=1 Tax=Candidatus Dojkabacteria bacterium TaxID=2099670 RepID=A0A955LAG1_9BACT|nr:50S ribosomal protein L13 [Candidatus Dojkabacteria bacterium]
MKPRTISQNEIQEKWYVVDAAGQRIGRVASITSELLLGKNDPKVRSNLDPKSKVIVINADKIDFTPKRGFSKFYKSYSGFPGGLTFISLEEKFEKNKTFPLENAIKGMLPKNKRGSMIFTNLKVYEGSEHPHTAQQPITIDLSSYKL